MRNDPRINAARRPDTVADVAWRYADTEARRLAALEIAARYPTITPENFREACSRQEEAIGLIREVLLAT